MDKLPLATKRLSPKALCLAGIGVLGSCAGSYRTCPEPAAQLRRAAPNRLSQTGLYADIASKQLAPGVRPYSPRFELWSDEATKHRFIWMPPGSQIDISDMDAWAFPEGTTLWKEFVAGTDRIETRMLQKVGPTDADWLAVSFVWNEGEDEALLSLDGVVDVRHTAHDVPAARDCNGCHGGTQSPVLGFSAIQLDRPTTVLDGEWTLRTLAAEGRLTTGPAEGRLTTEPAEGRLTTEPAEGRLTTQPPVEERPTPEPPPVLPPIPGGGTAQRVLGYLHANCGHCHNPKRPPESEGARCYNPRSELDLSLRVDGLAAGHEPGLYRTAVGTVIRPGDPEGSPLYQLIRGDYGLLGSPMPPLGSELPDPYILPALAEFIRQLPAAQTY